MLKERNDDEKLKEIFSKWREVLYVFVASQEYEIPGVSLYQWLTLAKYILSL